MFPDRNQIISAGNFHGEYPAKALDYLAIGVHELAAMSERRYKSFSFSSIIEEGKKVLPSIFILISSVFFALHNHSFKCPFASVCVTLLLLTREAKKCKLVFSRYEAPLHWSFATAFHCIT